MKNKLKRSALALLHTVLSIFSLLTSQVHSLGLMKILSDQKPQDGGSFFPNDETLSDRNEGLLDLKENRGTITSIDETTNEDVERVSVCRLSDAFLTKISKPSSSKWIVDDVTVELLQSSLQHLISCTKPQDIIEFRTREIINITESLKIFHELEFVTNTRTSSDGLTTIACPETGPVLLINAPSFKVDGLKIVRCSKSAGLGTIVVRPRSKVSFSRLYIQDNKNTGLFVKRNSNVSLIDALLQGNQASKRGGAIHAKGESVINIINSTIKGNEVKTRFGGGIFLGDHIVAIITNCTVTGNVARRGGGAYLRNETKLKLTNSTFTNNSALELGGGMYLDRFNNVITVGSLISKNTVSNYGGGGITMAFSNSVTVLESAIANNYANWGGGIESYDANNVTILRSLIIENEGEYQGSGMFLWYSNIVNVSGSIVLGNAASHGGAMFFTKLNKATITNSLFLRNKGVYNGNYVGVYLEQNNNLFIVKKFSISNQKEHFDGFMPFYTSRMQRKKNFLSEEEK